MKQKVSKIYYSQQRQTMKFYQVYITMIKSIWRSRWFIWMLFARDYFLANKRSFLGMGWLFLAPALSSMSWIAMNLLGVLNPGELAVPFPIFVLIGTSFWTLFNNTYMNNVSLFDPVGAMLGSVNFPRETLIIVQSGKSLANFLIASTLNTAILLFMGIYPNIYWLSLPLLIIPLLMLAISLGLMLMIIKNAIPDLERVFAFLFPMLMFITPIVFLPTAKSDKFLFLITYNPLTYLIGLPRDMVLFGHSEGWNGFWISSGVVTILFVMVLRAFYIAEELLIEKRY
ncbi:hypothetical protein PVA44_06625 (plasmid) [Entomospira nematocerorum]|uniref:ABC-2 type transporter domain-containing protein n=1 Tax=Entomospira nematocerorum TaxID=2719987 RepID=A0A968GD34_9SPIO|nr:hypothetical protein [Entomospira nematocera]NIZ47579.1 hypothetical protein [Entomospira nematocera]WDI34583.1 hypothetical protein PVA44_06625 [Entomospira nematocera]